LEDGRDSRPGKRSDPKLHPYESWAEARAFEQNTRKMPLFQAFGLSPVGADGILSAT